MINSYAHMKVTNGEYNEVIITPKRIRIYNPGTIALNKSPHDFANGTIGSKIRNPLIALTLYKNKSIEAFGTGFKRVFDLCAKDNIEYRYDNDGMGFYFEFLRSNVSNDTNNDTIDDTLTKTEIIVLDFMKNNKGILYNASVAATELSKSRITIQRTITSLIDKGIILRIGNKKCGYWKVKDK